MQKKQLTILPVVLLLTLTGCVNLAPDYERPAAPVESAWPQGEAYATTEAKRAALPAWKDFIVDERLEKVIDLGLENNRDLRVAALNVERARALYGVQRSELFPTVAAAAQNAAQHTPETLSATGRSSTGHQYTAQLAMSSYEIDFFGRVRNLNEQALQSYLASDDARRSAKSTLIGQIAMTWLTYGADVEQLKLQRETLASQEESFRLVEESFRLGAVSQLDYEQARTTVAAARASIAAYQRAVAVDRNALQLLVGAPISEELLPTGIELASTLKVALPEGMPSEVLLNRPDVQQAERSLRAANASIGVARAAFFPSVSLSLGGGTGSLHLSDLFGGNSGMWSFTPNVALPIFTGGRNLANLEAARVDERIAATNYEKAIQTAFREVADALATEGTIEGELKSREEYADAAGKAYEISNSRYQHGAAAYTEVLDAQRAKVSAEQVLITTQLARASSLVTLYKVLGGGALEEPAKQGID